MRCIPVPQTSRGGAGYGRLQICPLDFAVMTAKAKQVTVSS
jgi:hypothetical protein